MRSPIRADRSWSTSSWRARCRRASHMSQALARALAERCRALQTGGMEACAAERHTFEELLREPTSQTSIDPHLYEDFLQAYAPGQRRARGVYYTPAPVVAAQVHLAADLLAERLGCGLAFGDERVLVVDPAAGSGAYPLAVLSDTLARAPDATRTLASQRMRLYEPLAGAASLARAQGLDVVECDVLHTPIALDAPLVVCLGNPPYRRAQRQVAPADLLERLSLPGAGIHLKNAYNAYVYFWHWAIRAVFEQRQGPGIVSFISASSYLRGPGFGGLRAMLQRALDELWVLDLEGDDLAARRTANVFSIRTPVAVAMGVRYAAFSSRQPAVIHYARLTGSRAAKLAVLNRLHHLSDLTWRTVPVDHHAAFVPQTSSAYRKWPPLTELFPWQLSGAQLKRTWPVGQTAEVLHERWARLLALGEEQRGAALHETRERNLDATPLALRDPSRRLPPLRGLGPGSACIAPVRYAYRSFDRQWVLPDARLGDFMRPALWRVGGPRQIYVTSLLTNVLGPGPAAIATALVPDLDHFRGSFGARAVIPLWRDAAATVPNVSRSWLESVSQRFGADIDADALLAYCYALLTTRRYVKRFEEELRTPGPRVPITGDEAVFRRGAELGQRLLALHTFRSMPRGTGQCLAAPGPAYPADFAYDPRRQLLRIGNGWFGPLAPEVW